MGRNEKKEASFAGADPWPAGLHRPLAAVVYRRRCADGVGRIDSRPGAGPVGHSRRRVCGVDDPAFLADAPTAGGAAAGHPAVFSAFWNTCLLAFAQIAGQLVVAAPASWAFAKLRFAGRRFLLLGYIALMVLPFQVLMVPNYLIATRLGIYDTPLSVILPGVFSAFPVFIMTRSFQDVPNELLEAAKLDGATAWQIFWKIGVPLGYAGIFAALVLNFIEGWNAVEQPLLFLKSQSNWPLSMYMNDIVTDNLGIAMAASLLSLIPAMLVFLYGQTYLELGIQAGGIKA